MNLGTLKSAEILADADKLRQVVSRHADSGPGEQFHSTYTLDDEGRLTVSKLSSFAELRAEIPEGDELDKLFGKVGITPTDELRSRVVAYWASDERVDGHGDIVLQNWHFDRFKTNPVIPFGHEWGQPPVGSALDWEVRNRKAADYEGKALWLLAVFAGAETSERAESVYRLVRSGFLRAASVGFYPGKIIDITDEEEREELGLGRWGYILDENQLLEMSPVTIPANDGAGVATTLALGKKKHGLVAGDVEVACELARRRLVRCGSGDLGALWKEERDALLASARTVFRTAEFQISDDVEVPVVPETREKTGAVPGLTLEAEPDENVVALRAEVTELRGIIDGMAALLEDALPSIIRGQDEIRDAIQARSEVPAGDPADDGLSDGDPESDPVGDPEGAPEADDDDSTQEIRDLVASLGSARETLSGAGA